MLAIAPLFLTMDSSNVSRAPRVGHKKSRKGCAQCKRRHVKVGSLSLLIYLIRQTDLRVFFRIRSATKRHPARIAYDTVSLALSPEGPMSPETMRGPNNEVLRRQYRVFRQERLLHMIRSDRVQQRLLRHKEHLPQVRQRVRPIRPLTIQYGFSQDQSIAVRHCRIKDGCSISSLCTISLPFTAM